MLSHARTFTRKTNPMNDKRFIWRIETGSGEGAYHGGLCYGEGEYFSEYHPSLYGDGVNCDDFKSAHLFGFNSIFQARRWFTSIHDLQDWERSKDAKLVVYKRGACYDIIEGKSQVVFVPAGQKVALNASDLHRLRVSELVTKVAEEFSRLRPFSA